MRLWFTNNISVFHVLVIQILLFEDAAHICIEDIQVFEMYMPFISSSETKNAYFMSGEATNEIFIFSLHEMK